MTDEQFLKRGREITGFLGFPGKRNSVDGTLSSSGRRAFWFSRSGNCFMSQAFAPSAAAIVAVQENDGCGVVFYTSPEDEGKEPKPENNLSTITKNTIT